MSKSVVTFEALYDKYSGMLYGIALEISRTEKEAEDILISTFQKAYRQNIHDRNGPSPLADLIKLMIQTACEKFHPGQPTNILRLKCLESTPMLHRTFCEPKGFERYCNENSLNRAEGLKQMRSEFHLLRTAGLINQH